MIREDALKLIKEYANYAEDELDTLYKIHERFPSDGSENKAMRWLGFCQGVLFERGVFSLDDIKDHSKNRRVTIAKV